MILDTNALSAFVAGDKGLSNVISHRSRLSVPAIVLGEYLFGIRQSRHRSEYEDWLDRNLMLFDLLAVGRETASEYAGIRGDLKAAGRPIPSNDIWIAALAREHNQPLITRDTHFDLVAGLRLVAW